MKTIKKKKSEAFGEDCFLLGKFQGEYIWLEDGRWDCGWYWGFGYVEVYTNQKHPNLSSDIISHRHFNGLVSQKNKHGNYINHLNQILQETVLTQEESWELSDLMKSFYTLKAAAEIYHSGLSGLTSFVVANLKNAESEKRINEIEIPSIIKRVREILTPKEASHVTK